MYIYDLFKITLHFMKVLRDNTDDLSAIFGLLKMNVQQNIWDQRL